MGLDGETRVGVPTTTTVETGTYFGGKVFPAGVYVFRLGFYQPQNGTYIYLTAAEAESLYQQLREAFGDA